MPLPYFTNSSDPVFLSDCQLLRHDRLVTLSWWEAIRPENFQFPPDLVNFISVHGSRDFGKAVAWYHRPDKSVVAVWKKSRQRQRSQQTEQSGAAAA